MALRLVQVTLPEGEGSLAEERLGELSILDRWRERLEEGEVRHSFLMDATETEPLLDALEARHSGTEAYRVVILPVQASLPRPEEEEDEQEKDEPEGEGEEGRERVSREELYAQLSDAARPTPVYAALSALSAGACTFGLLNGDLAVIIGAMVIAPLLGPLVALSLAATLADGPLARDGLVASAIGAGATLAVSAGVGVLVPVDPGLSEIASRTSLSLGHLALALAAGSAGTLAYTSGVSAAIVGVMVAVALVPPLATGGLLLGAGHVEASTGAFLLTLGNLASINLAGVLTFLAQGIRPNRWWEAERARRSTAVAVAVWSAVLLALAAVILWRGVGPG